MKNLRVFLWLWIAPVLLAILFVLLTDGKLDRFDRPDINLFTVLFFFFPAGMNAFVFPKFKQRFPQGFKAFAATSFVLCVIFFAFDVTFWGIVLNEFQGVKTAIFRTIAVLFSFSAGFFLVRLFEVRSTARDFNFNQPPKFFIRIFSWVALPQALLLAFIIGSENTHKPDNVFIAYCVGAFCFAVWITVAAILAVRILSVSDVFKRQIPLLIFVGTLITVFFGWIYIEVLIPTIKVQGMLTMVFPCFFSTSGVTFLILQQNKDRKLKLLNTSFAKKESEYHRLKQQVSPHFFFNNLNMLLSFVESDPQKALVFGKQLSGVYRKFLKSEGEDFVPLQDEIAFISEYLEIYKAKFGEAVSIAIRVDSSDTGFILADSLQEIVDNIFKHNIFEEKNPIVIELFSDDENLIVRNSVHKKTFGNTSYIGLENIKKRYELLTESEFSTSEENGFFVANLPILKSE